MTKLIPSIVMFLLLVIGIASCQQEEPIYSCDLETNDWVKTNLEEIRSMNKSTFLNITNPVKAKGAYRALTSSQKESFWLDKLTNTMRLDWSDAEKSHINSLITFIKSNNVFGDKKTEAEIEKIEEFLFLWIKNGINNLNWNKSIIYSVCGTLEEVCDTKGTLPQNKEKVIINNSTCQCSTKSDFCGDIYGRIPDTGSIPVVVAVCEETGCTKTTSGCGALLLYSCTGNCNILNM